MPPSPQIVVLHTSSIPKEVFAEFLELVATEDLNLKIESRKDPGPVAIAGIEGFLQTAVIVFISKSYFDGFLKEMGKDHYSCLKAGLKTLWKKLLGHEAPKVTLVASKGKLSEIQTYSLLYSILAEASDDLTFKLLFQRKMSTEDYNETIAAFLTFLKAYHDGNLGADSLEKMKATRIIDRTILLVFNRETKVIEPINSTPEKP